MSFNERWDKSKKKDRKYLMRFLVFLIFMGVWKVGELGYYGLMMLINKPSVGMFP
tara:strand:- start:650 stop:814 length:165 start_codon:yes stop_codon:yes gene_type:complete